VDQVGAAALGILQETVAGLVVKRRQRKRWKRQWALSLWLLVREGLRVLPLVTPAVQAVQRLGLG
jgi:hypothetical protein